MKFLLFFILCFNLFAQTPIGKITKLNGKVYRVADGEENRIALQIGSDVFEGDHVNTLERSFAKLEMVDGSKILVGPSSHFHLKEADYSGDRRQNSFDLLKGKIRANISKAQSDEEIQFNSRVVSIGVRGTEFLINSYDVIGKASEDIALLEGKVNANLEKIDFPQNNVDLNPGQVFNSNELAQTQSLDSIKTLSPKDLTKLKMNPESFLPEIQMPNGTFKNPGDLMRPLIEPRQIPVAVPISLTPTVGAIAVAKDKKIVSSKNPNTNKNLKDEPWDIRDAILNQEKMSQENKCYFWFYKPIPGRGGLERFRRVENCDEDEEDYE